MNRPYGFSPQGLLSPPGVAQKAQILTPFSLKICFSEFRNIPSLAEGDDPSIHPHPTPPSQETVSHRHCEGVKRPKQSHKNLKCMRLPRSPAMAGSLAMTNRDYDTVSKGKGDRSEISNTFG